MSVVRVGSNQQFSENWDNVFGGGKRKKSASKRGAKKKATSKLPMARRVPAHPSLLCYETSAPR